MPITHRYKYVKFIINMGADCCGGGSPEAAAAALAELQIEQPSQQQQTADVKPWEQIVEEKKPYYNKRVELFSAIKARQQAAVEAAKEANVPIKIVLPDGSEKPGVKGVTSPMDVANSISKSLAKKTVVAKVDGQVWDLCRPLEGDCALQLLNFEDPEGKEVSLRLVIPHHLDISKKFWA